MNLPKFSKLCAMFVCTFAAIFALSALTAAQQYQQTNFVSDIPGLAPTVDSHLLNPWGLISSPTSPWWVSDNNGGVSTLYDGNSGAIVPLVVDIPPLDAAGKGTGTPTGIVFSGGSGFTFHVKDTQAAAVFTFVTEDGTIVAWAPGVNPNDLAHDAFVVIDNSANPTAGAGAVYKGATIAQMTERGPSFLYVTNIRSGRIEVYDTNFNPVNLAGEDGVSAFSDREIPEGFAPFNVQQVNGNLYVTYAKQNAAKHDDFDFPGFGFVDKFSPTGKLLQRLEHGPWLNAPWGVAFAPANFGFFSNHLFIGNAGSGQIAVYDSNSGRFQGLLRDANGHAIQNDRLWALRFGNDNGAGPSNWLFFTAGISDEAHGLFGFFTPVDTSAPASH
ncbi:MAG: TIGR03118 family protein [Acidobacteria bacterium]|nr:TIGR03118 family protein [Acidobacteriota bacterium]